MSRRSGTKAECEKTKCRVWRIAIYIRLSKEDGRCLEESESVANQRKIIEEHIAGLQDGDRYVIVDEYVDGRVKIGLNQQKPLQQRGALI